MKRATKLLFIGLTLSVLLLAACAPAEDTGGVTEEGAAVEEPAEEAPAAEGAAGPLGLSVSTLNNPFFVTLRDGAESAAADAGVELVVVDAQDDPAQEATNIEDLIQ